MVLFTDKEKSCSASKLKRKCPWRWYVMLQYGMQEKTQKQTQKLRHKMDICRGPLLCHYTNSIPTDESHRSQKVTVHDSHLLHGLDEPGIFLHVKPLSLHLFSVYFFHDPLPKNIATPGPMFVYECSTKSMFIEHACVCN